GTHDNAGRPFVRGADELAAAARRAQHRRDSKPVEATMGRRGAAIAAAILLTCGVDGRMQAQSSSHATGAHQETSSSVPASPALQNDAREIRASDLPITVRPGTLGLLADTLAGRSIRLTSARVVGVFEPRVFLVDTQTHLFPTRDRDRVLVFI